jgi:hypothetical protein
MIIEAFKTCQRELFSSALLLPVKEQAHIFWQMVIEKIGMAHC